MIADLQDQIDAFEAKLGLLIRAYPDDAEFWPEFAAAASEAEKRVFAEHLPTFQDAMVSVLRRLGKVRPASTAINLPATSNEE